MELVVTPPAEESGEETEMMLHSHSGGSGWGEQVQVNGLDDVELGSKKRRRDS